MSDKSFLLEKLDKAIQSHGAPRTKKGISRNNCLYMLVLQQNTPSDVGCDYDMNKHLSDAFRDHGLVEK